MGRESREAMLARRAQIAKLALFGNPTQQEIADQLGIEQSTVCKHLKAIRQEWREAAQRDIAEIIAQELRKLDALELEALGQWERSKQDYEKRVIEDKPKGRNGGGRSAKVEKSAQCGDPRYLTVIIGIQDRRAKLLGTDKPAKIAPTDPTGEKEYDGLSDQELAQRIAELQAKVGAHGPS